MPTPLVFLLILSVLVLIHELGHFLAARMFGIKVEEFAFGLPFTKPILKIRRGETQYALYPLLFGGFVRLYGEEAEPEKKKEVKRDAGRDFWSRGKKQRMIVIAAGVVMNIVLALAGFFLLYGIAGVPVATRDKVTVLDVVDGSPAQEAGLAVEDRIVAVEGRTIESTEEFSRLMKSWGGIGVDITVERGKGTTLFEGIYEKEAESRVVRIVPRTNPPEGQGAIGVAINSFPYVQTVACSSLGSRCPFEIANQGVKSTGLWIGRVLDGLRSIGRSLIAGRTPEGVAGPVGIYQLTDVVAQAGWLPLVELTAILSVNLAVFNVLPIPALDGGRMFFIWLEWLRRRRLTAEFEQKVNSWGMAVLLILLALISLQDVIRLGIVEKLFGK